MIRGKIISIQKMNKAEIILIEYEKNNSRFYCYSLRNHHEYAVKAGDTVMFEEEMDALGPMAVNLSKVE